MLIQAQRNVSESGGKCDIDTKNYFPPRYFNLPQAGVTWDIPHKLVQKGALVVKLKPWHDAKSSFVPLNMSEYLGRAVCWGWLDAS
jgi:hypothetical protein